MVRYITFFIYQSSFKSSKVDQGQVYSYFWVAKQFNLVYCPATLPLETRLKEYWDACDKRMTEKLAVTNSLSSEKKNMPKLE